LHKVYKLQEAQLSLRRADRTRVSKLVPNKNLSLFSDQISAYWPSWSFKTNDFHGIWKPLCHFRQSNL